MTIGWFILYSNEFVTDQSPLEVEPLTECEVKWAELSLYIGGFLGTILLTMTGDVLGRKDTLVVLVVPQGVNIS